jgi:hypothetical protein
LCKANWRPAAVQGESPFPFLALPVSAEDPSAEETRQSLISSAKTTNHFSFRSPRVITNRVDWLNESNKGIVLSSADDGAGRMASIAKTES